MNATKPLLRSTLLAGCACVVVLLAAPAWSAGTAAAADRAALERQLAEARVRLEQAARDVASLSRQLWGDDLPGVIRMVQGPQRGAMIGVNIATEEARAEGVKVVGVSPGGPAESAGIRPDDVIVEVDGQTLVAKGDRSAAAQLTSYLRGLEPGRTVRLDCLRAGQRRTFEIRTVAAEPPLARMLRERGWLPEGGMPPMPFEEFLGPERPLRSLELVPVTPQLGRYFGTEQGLLVVRAPAEPAFKLEEGDVLLSIEGRVPESPGHAFRILRSYQPGEDLRLQVLRMRKRVEVQVRMPETDPLQGGGRRPAPPPPPPRPPPSAGDEGPA